MPNASLIHLATHGLFNEHQGLESSLAFSTSDHGEGFLTAAEILDLDLSAELVVLSACNTGRGKITGDGVIGLSRIVFISGGAKYSCFSLVCPRSSHISFDDGFLSATANQPQSTPGTTPGNAQYYARISFSPVIGQHLCWLDSNFKEMLADKE